jgi:hypothetical protein
MFYAFIVLGFGSVPVIYIAAYQEEIHLFCEGEKHLSLVIIFTYFGANPHYTEAIRDEATMPLLSEG